MSEDIHNLLGKYFSGQVSKEEEAQVLEWKSFSRENENEFDQLEKLWYGFEDEHIHIFDTDRAWKNVDDRIKSARATKTPVISMSRIVMGIAASLLLVLGIWWISSLFSNNMQTVVADVDVKEIQLEDGTRVFLRKGSSLRFPEEFGGDARSVTLQGEAFFDVTKNPSKPFMITADEALVKVLGTSFTVNTKVEGVSLIVKTGRVSFSSISDATKNLVVNAGEKALLSDSGITKEPNTDPNFNAWQSRQLSFNDTPLEEVARMIGDAYNVTVTINKDDAAQIAKKGVTIEFRDQSLSSVLKELELITTYEIRETGDHHYEISFK